DVVALVGVGADVVELEVVVAVDELPAALDDGGDAAGVGAILDHGGERGAAVGVAAARAGGEVGERAAVDVRGGGGCEAGEVEEGGDEVGEADGLGDVLGADARA